MGAPLRGAKQSAKGPVASGTGPLFSYEIRREGKPLASLRGIATDEGVTVEADVYPIGRPAGEPPIQRPFSFPSAETAQRFADETLIALEYLDCEIVGQ